VPSLQRVPMLVCLLTDLNLTSLTAPPKVGPFAVEGGAKIKNPKSTAATRAVVGTLDRHVGADS
jgi:hypothetical protein